MERYSEYKDSGVEWIGEIPSHWILSKVMYVLDFHNNVRIPLSSEDRGKRQGEYRYYGSTGIIDFIDDYLFDGEYILIGEDGSNLRLRTYRLSNVVSGKFWVNNHSHILRSKDGVNHYYSHLLELTDFSNYITGSTQPKLTMDNLKIVPMVSPPFAEQQQIVSYLDTKTQLIDSLLEQTERKIELLKEQRNAIINETVTKGLNPNVEMKDSGVEWIGEIPNGWVTSKLGFYTTKIGSGSTPRGGSEVYVDSGVPFIRSQNVHFDGLRVDDVSFIEQKVHDSMKGSTVVREDVLLNITGGSIGRCCVVNFDSEMNVNQHVSIIRTTNRLINYFLNYIISCDLGQSQVRYNLTGSNREGLTIEGIRDFQITIPPLSEQQQIVEYLDEQTQKIDKTISLEEKKIKLLKQYRQSLISEVVTGKRKVTTDE